MTPLRLPCLAALLLLVSACSDAPPEPELLAPPSREGWDSSEPFPGFTLVRSLESRKTYLVDMSGTAATGSLAGSLISPGGAL